MELAAKVVSLKQSKRQHESEKRFMKILNALRCEEPEVRQP
jgi:hypothetical protein